MFWANLRTVKMTMETGEREMELITDIYFYDKQVCKSLHLLVHDLLKEVFEGGTTSKKC